MNPEAIETEPRRFKGCPPICTQTNLPAHENLEMAQAFHANNSLSCKVYKIWQCSYCLGWHMWTIAPSPAGASSGNERPYPVPKWVKETVPLQPKL